MKSLTPEQKAFIANEMTDNLIVDRVAIMLHEQSAPTLTRREAAIALLGSTAILSLFAEYDLL